MRNQIFEIEGFFRKEQKPISKPMEMENQHNSNSKKTIHSLRTLTNHARGLLYQRICLKVH